MLRPDIRNTAQRFIDSREPKHQRQIIGKIVALCQDPHPADSRLLRGTELGERRVTAGEYRIIYWVESAADRDSPGILHVDAVGKRNDDEVYRRFRRQQPRGD
jgi:mRNA interferase RelE/StbE